MESSYKIIISLLATVILLSAANLGIATLGISSSVNPPEIHSTYVQEPVSDISVSQTSSASDERSIFIQIPARPEMALKDYYPDYTVDKALQDIRSKIEDFGSANGSYDISIMKGDDMGSVVLSDTSCAGDACGMKYLAFRNGVQQLSIGHNTFSSAVTMKTDGREYVIQPKFGNSACNQSYTKPSGGVELLGITVTGEGTTHSYDLPEPLEVSCYLEANSGYINPYFNVDRVTSGAGYFGADLEVSNVHVMVYFSDNLTTQTGTWR